MTKYLETKKNSIEEAISSVVKGEGFASDAQRRAAFAQGYKAKGKKDKNEEIDEAKSQGMFVVIEKGSKNKVIGQFRAKDKAIDMMKKNAGSKIIQIGKFATLDDKPVDIKIGDELSDTRVRLSKKIKEGLDENGFVVGKVKMPKMKGGAKLQSKTNFDFRLFDPEDSPGSDKANDEMNREIVKASKMKDKTTAMAHMNKIQRKHSKHGATDTEPREVISQVLNRVFGESVELGEGYESEVLKVLRDADIEGYFKMGKLYVSRRDARDAKKALEDSDEITKLPKMVMEDERMKKLTPRQRQALARVQAKPKSQVSLPKMPDFMKLKKEENEMDIVDTIRNVVEKKLDPVNKDAVKKKFDDRKDKDIDNDGDVDSTDKYLHKRRKAISKAIAKDNNEAYDIGKDYAQHTLDVTPGQDKKDVDKMLNVAYTKNQSMRESLAKVLGLDEGKSPFQKEEEKPLTKTMTGQKPTTVKVNPKIEEK